MSVKLLTENHLEFLSLKGGCTGSSGSTLVKMWFGNHMGLDARKPVFRVCEQQRPRPASLIGKRLLFDLILYVPSTIFQLNRDGSSWVEPVLS